MSRGSRGFTLFEVLVALAIMAIALTALLRASGLAAENSAILRSRMQAGWIAQNRVALLQARSEWPATGKTEGETEASGQRWRWEQEVSETPNPDFRKLAVRILSADARRYVLAETLAYVVRPQGGS